MLIAAAGVAAYQLSFFAAVADTGVAVGTIVALGSAPALTGVIEWALERAALILAGLVVLAAPDVRRPAPVAA